MPIQPVRIDQARPEDAPELARMVGELLGEIMVDELGHIGERRSFLGHSGVAFARGFLPVMMRRFFADIPEAAVILDVKRMIQEALVFDYSGIDAAITERAMRGELDFRASFKERMALLKGLDVSVLDQIGASLRLTEGAEHLFAELKRLGYKTAILSGGFSYFAKQLQARLGIDYVFANELEIVDGKLTGVAIEPIVDAQRKADLLSELAQKEGLRLEQTIAVGDGANDLPMLALAGLGVAFRAKPLVKQSAKQAISTLGLDGILYLLGFRDRDGRE